MASDKVRINGNLVSMASVIFKIDGERMFGFTSIDWDESRERAHGFAADKTSRPAGTTAGEYVPSPVKIKFYTHTAQLVLKNLAASAGGISYGDAKVGATLQVDEPGNLSQDVEFLEMQLTKKATAFARGNEPAQEDFEFTNCGIITDGLTMYTDPNA